ncbi:hypothetical protein R1flu_001312 [Riccia fluitans]|uniref:Uncharacterized protein n=1 Tax=Riccia fluitans TaxID=41844 RepID=A0ABD1Y663_9MARC
MASAGGAGGGGAASGESNTKRYRLQKESELRVEVGWEAPLKVQLLSGTAEIFGTELPPAVSITFPPAHKIAIFTWNGATVELDGAAEVAYVADEARCGYVWPLVEDGRLECPLIPKREYPSKYLCVNTDLRRVLMKELARTLESQFAANPDARAAGMLINTKGWVEGVYEFLLQAINTFMQTKYRFRSRVLKTKEYFNGPANDLSPHSCDANFTDFQVYRIGGGPQAPRPDLPIGVEPSADLTCGLSRFKCQRSRAAALEVAPTFNFFCLLFSLIFSFVLFSIFWLFSKICPVLLGIRRRPVIAACVTYLFWS